MNTRQNLLEFLSCFTCFSCFFFSPGVDNYLEWTSAVWKREGGKGRAHPPPLWKPLKLANKTALYFLTCESMRCHFLMFLNSHPELFCAISLQVFASVTSALSVLNANTSLLHAWSGRPTSGSGVMSLSLFLFAAGPQLPYGSNQSTDPEHGFK